MVVTMKSLQFLFLILPILSVNGLGKVRVSQCCKSGESVRVLNDNDISCEPGTNELPHIYSPRSKSYLERIPNNWIVQESNLPLCKNKTRVVVKPNAMVSFILFDNGNLLLIESSEHIPPSEYCYDSKTVAYCAAAIQRSVKIKKCCGDGAVFSETKQSCIVMNVTDYKINVNANVTFINGFPNCEADYVIAGKLSEGELMEDGSLRIAQIVLPPLDYCLEHLFENATKSAGIITCHSHVRDASVSPGMVPSGGPGVTVQRGDLRLKLYPAGLLLSAVFLAATLAAGTVLPAAHHHLLHWRCQTNHVACLLVADVLLAITQLAGDGIGGRGLCVTMAISMHFLFLAAFFWLNTMCFNIWWTFRDLRPGTLEKRQERCRLRLYGLYAWGGPFLIAMVALILDTLPHDDTYTFLRPKFGEETCWFPGDMEILAYFFGPVGVLLIVNLLLFGLTARELTCGLWKRELVKSTTERAALGRVCMKLVVVMGVTWIADVLSWAVGGPQALWYITDLINALQGVFIFIVVACQPQVWTAIKRLWCKRQSLAADITGNGNHHSSSSHGLPSYGESVTNHSVSNTTRSVPLETSC